MAEGGVNRDNQAPIPLVPAFSAKKIVRVPKFLFLRVLQGWMGTLLPRVGWPATIMLRQTCLARRSLHLSIALLCQRNRSIGSCSQVSWWHNSFVASSFSCNCMPYWRLHGNMHLCNFISIILILWHKFGEFLRNSILWVEVAYVLPRPLFKREKCFE